MCRSTQYDLVIDHKVRETLGQVDGVVVERHLRHNRKNGGANIGNLGLRSSYVLEAILRQLICYFFTGSRDAVFGVDFAPLKYLRACPSASRFFNGVR